ncbi:Rrf2 family transcriptional regulator [Rhodoblastus acidophilus]|uniref:Rrf2 family transcriptional regulator n=1 Tax=Candidatus Rhodoblastus alkanivorans TaxID=2954117 RepID=A0ABS9Z335_9HYPH|nr:Rrf2 family transcriptional regulator [Candidatus Rhodoblastus alkanivorans]MCI4677328.1 Rrf2 family transcriptional regulator [Candidatus Rhodoblastus alkanivorans]MCI4682063.1 Rrf2 family transcriptional regulator [Candidatus Rhodoblastus alkanivorans]MDI4639365.1 Rrf2 family transcriptional regulator [Rhodoblastus acidophilus]
MKLTSYSNFTLRVLMVAAARQPELTTIGEIADAFQISKAHLTRCVHQLGQWGYIETVRGNGGGFRLARDATAISVGEVIRRTEEGFDVVECFDAETATCPLLPRCGLRPALLRATDVFLATLDGFTLAEIAANGEDLLDALALQRPAAACDEARAAF